MFDELQSRWQDITPEAQAGIKNGCVLVTALLVGYVLGSMVARVLRSRNFDAAVRLPGGAASDANADTGITPTFLAGWLVRFSIWAWAGAWLAAQYGWGDFVPTVGLVLRRTWAVAGVLVVVLALGGMLAHRLVEFLDGWRTTPEAPGHRLGAAAPRGSVAGAVGAGVYGLVALLVLLITADMFDWPLTRSSTQALWQFAQKLFIATAALVICLLGARWARDLMAEAAATPEKRAGQYTALGMVSLGTLLALATLFSNAGVLVGMAALAAFGVCLWLARGYLVNIVAGLQLRNKEVSQVWLDGNTWQVADVGFLQSHVIREGAVHCLQNRVVLDARFHGEAGRAAAR